MTTLRRATEADWTAIENLLTSSDLPLDGARGSLDAFVVAELDGRIVGCATMERYGTAALLRSVAIFGPYRGRRIGEKLVETVIQNARGGVQSVFLLTTTAADWFPRFGFIAVSRNEVPESLQGSPEFRGACPASAVVMNLTLR
jgi:N-acetylglutamate synthase-like GNAT family acetyltransferase